MTTCTPTLLLPYAEGSDRPCDIFDTSCDFAEAVETQLNSIEDVVDRTADTVPFAYMMTSVNQNYNNNTIGDFTPLFDTTLVDTNNMVDLGLDNTALTIQTAGVYTFFYSLEMRVENTITSILFQPLLIRDTGSDVSPNNDFTVGNFASLATLPVKFTGARVSNVCTTGEFIANVAAGTKYTTSLNSSGTLGTITVITALRIGAMWLRDPL